MLQIDRGTDPMETDVATASTSGWTRTARTFTPANQDEGKVPSTFKQFVMLFILVDSRYVPTVNYWYSYIIPTAE